MKFFHGTTEANWEKIQKEGVLWGGDSWHKTNGKEGYRYTYLTPDIKVARMFGNVMLEVEYEPVGNRNGIDNYGFDPPPGMSCWQFSVFVPISISDIHVVLKG